MSEVLTTVLLITAFSVMAYHFGRFEQKRIDWRKIHNAFSIHIEASFGKGHANALIDLFDWIKARW